MSAIEHWGTQGPLVLCIHGIGSSRRDFVRLGEALAGTHRVVAYDQRGHGDRGGEPGPMQLTALVDDLRAILATLDEPVATLVGASWGGAVALLAGSQGLAASLVLIDPMIRVRAGTFSEYVDDLAELVAEPAGPARDAAVRTAFATAHPADREGKVHALRALDLESIRQLGDDNAVEHGGWDLRPVLASLTIPATILVAGEESVILAEDLEQVADGVEIRHVAEHGHTLHRSALELVVDTVRKHAIS